MIITFILGAVLGVILMGIIAGGTRSRNDGGPDTVRIDAMSMNDLSLVRPAGAGGWAVMADDGRCLVIRDTVREAIDAGLVKVASHG